MGQRKHSRKRDAILDCVRSTRTHPSAEWVYAALKPEIPDLSLGTVYRNLTLFKEEGTILSLGTVKGQERFDGTLTPHTHFVCTCCGRVLDLPSASLPEQVAAALDLYGYTAHSWDLRINGHCPSCMERSGVAFFSQCQSPAEPEQ